MLKSHQMSSKKAIIFMFLSKVLSQNLGTTQTEHYIQCFNWSLIWKFLFLWMKKKKSSWRKLTPWINDQLYSGVNFFNLRASLIILRPSIWLLGDMQLFFLWAFKNHFIPENVLQHLKRNYESLSGHIMFYSFY